MSKMMTHKEVENMLNAIRCEQMHPIEHLVSPFLDIPEKTIPNKNDFFCFVI